MALFAPEIKGDLLYFDLDTVILQDIRHFADVPQSVFLNDFWSETQLASGLMFLTEEDRSIVWHEWIKEPHRIMRQNELGGDQTFLRRISVIRRRPRWQDIFPKQIISYKVHIQTKHGDKALPHTARVVCFHGQPRPWNVSLPWIRGDGNGNNAEEPTGGPAN